MHVMHIMSGKRFNGANGYALNVLRYLEGHGVQVTAVCVPRCWLLGELRSAAANIQVIESDLHRWPPDELRRIHDVCQQQHVDVIHTHSSRAHFFGVLLRRFFSVPCVATGHQRHVQLHWPFNDFVIANSEATRKYQLRWNFVRPTRCETVYCPIDVQRFERVTDDERTAVRASWGLNGDEWAIGIVGGVKPEKGHLHLMRAMPRVLESHPAARLVIVGEARDPFLSELRNEAAPLRIEQAVVWAGFRRDIPQVMHALDVCVCASFEESFGLTAAEASAARRPVVATNVGGLGEAVADGETGILIPPRSDKALASALLQLAGDVQLGSRFGNAGRERVSRLFSVESHVQSLLDIYERVTQRSRGRRRAA